jgi:transposase InsO family protein
LLQSQEGLEPVVLGNAVFGDVYPALVFNTDQGVQFTAQAWTDRLEAAGVAVSMDGRGRCLDNVKSNSSIG